MAYSTAPLYYYRENSFNVSNAKGIKNKYQSISTYVDHVKKIIYEKTVINNDIEQLKEGSNY